MEQTKTCNICQSVLPIKSFPRKNKHQHRGYCKKCNKIRKELVQIKKQRDPELDKEAEIEVHGVGRNGKRYRSIVSYDKAVQLVEGKVARIIHPTLIQKIYDEESFRKMIFEREMGMCFYCGQPAATIDHIVPRRKGGSSTFRNCVAACSPCNEVKDSLHVDTFLYYSEPVSCTPEIPKEQYVKEQLKEAGKTVDALERYIDICLKKLSHQEKQLAAAEADELKDKLYGLFKKIDACSEGRETQKEGMETRKGNELEVE